MDTARRLELSSQLPALEQYAEASPRSSAQSSPVVGVPPSAMTGRAQDITDTVKQTPAQKKALKQANAQEWTTALSTANKELAPRLQTAKDTLVSRDHKFDVYGSKYLLAPVTGIVRMAHSVTLAVTNFFMAVINFLGSLSNCCGSTKTLAERREISKQKLEMCGLQMKSALNGLRQAIPGFGAAITSAKLEEARHNALLAATTAGRNITIHTAPVVTPREVRRQTMIQHHAAYTIQSAFRNYQVSEARQTSVADKWVMLLKGANVRAALNATKASFSAE